tara:strand:- start:458 stop:697 length:240 start_codon:yes stop_codon:yes gene_type:complete
MICYISEKGHNNFYYATNTKALLDKSASYTTLAWLSGNRKQLVAIKVQKKYITPLTVNKIYINSIIENNNEYVVVWIDK